MERFAVAVSLQRTKGTVLSDRLIVDIIEATNRNEALGIMLNTQGIINLVDEGFGIILHVTKPVNTK